MAADVSFICFIKSNDSNWETFEFTMGDIFVRELNKFIKSDSVDAAKAFFNLEALKTAKAFSFYTMSESTARWALGEKRKLNDFFEYKKSSKSAFTLKIVAVSSGFTWIVECRECQPVQTLLAPTPSGVMQFYSVKYSEALIDKLASHPGIRKSI